MIEIESSKDYQELYSLLLFLVNFFCNMIILLTFARTKYWIFTGKMIISFALFNAFINSAQFLTEGNEESSVGFLGVTEGCVSVSSLITMLLLLSDTIMTSKTINLPMFFSIYYLTVVSFYVLCLTLWLTVDGFFAIFQLIVFSTVGVSIVTLLIKDVYRAYRYCRNLPLDEGTNHRMNIAGTYIYSWVFLILSFIVEHVTNSLIASSLIATPKNVSSLTLVIYLFYSNDYFRNGFLELRSKLLCRSVDSNAIPGMAVQFRNDLSSSEENVSNQTA